MLSWGGRSRLPFAVSSFSTSPSLPPVAPAAPCPVSFAPALHCSPTIRVNARESVCNGAEMGFDQKGDASEESPSDLKPVLERRSGG